jgi:hypothetical protein
MKGNHHIMVEHRARILKITNSTYGLKIETGLTLIGPRLSMTDNKRQMKTNFKTKYYIHSSTGK